MRHRLDPHAATAVVTGEALTFTAPAQPSNPDAQVTVGLRFAVTAPGTWIGNRWRVPTVAGTVHSAAGWNDDTLALLAGPIAFVEGALGADQDVLFAAGVPVVAGVNYFAGMWVTNYAFTPAYGWPAHSPSNRIFTDSVATDVCRFHFAAAPTLPGPGEFSTANFHVSPLITF